MPIWRSRRSVRLTNAWSSLDGRNGRVFLLLSATYLAAFVLVLTLGAVWARDDAVPSVRVLGSGSRLSLLVTSGRARLLIATGDDASAFANALGKARHPTNRRVDIVLLAGDTRDLPVASRAIRDHPESTAFTIDGPLVAHLAEFGLSPDQVIAKPTRISLPGELYVTISPSTERDGNWRAAIAYGDTIVWAASNTSELYAAPDSSAVILVDDYEAEAATTLQGKLLVLPSRAASWTTLRQDAIAADNGQFWASRVPPGRAIRLTFTSNGLRLPPTARSIALTTKAN